MKAYNIEWDIDMDEVYELFDEMEDEPAAKALNVSLKEYKAYAEEDRNDRIEDYFRHCPAALDELLGLPDEVEIPKELVDDGDIADWLSDTYGYCLEGFALDTDNIEPIE